MLLQRLALPTQRCFTSYKLFSTSVGISRAARPPAQRAYKFDKRLSKAGHRPNPNHPFRKTSPPRYKDAEPPISLEVAHQRLLDGLEAWCKQPSVVQILQELNFRRSEANMLLDKFLIFGTRELRKGNKTPEALYDTWKLPQLRDTLQKDFDHGLHKSFLNRCIDFALMPEAALQPERRARLSSLRQKLLVDTPSQWYPRARAMKRKLILHVGPTNSGKTYNALRALASAKRGVYGGPLRLLAHEVWERLNNGSIMAPLPARGVDIFDAGGDSKAVPSPTPTPSPQTTAELYGRSCNLITGEERRIVDSNADLVSCTLEMMPVESSFDVAVIDEIQMIGDIDRGGAWTRAVLGVCAQEVHMCGEATVIDLIRRIAEETGDELEINHYERLTPLKVSEPLSGSYKNIEKGDCVVAFSRKDIFATKAAIEQETGLQCAVAYGKLPPEVRSRQAELFNDPASGFDVLVASDAIGMGLNLKIKRMIFSTVTKWDGREEVYLSLSQTKQLAGRAGRFGTGQGNEGGLVTTFQSADIQHLQEAMESENPPITQAIINLPYDARHDVYQSLATDSGIARASAITELLTIPSTNYFPRPSDHDLPRLAFLDKISSGAPFTDLDSVAIAPFQWSNRFDGDAQEELMRTFFRTLNVALKPLFERTGCSKSVQDARKIQETITAAAANAVNPDAEQSDSSIDATDAAVEASLIDEQIIKSTLAGLEPAHRLLVLYLWMSWRRPLAFQDQELAFEYKAEVENHISFLLNHLRRSPDLIHTEENKLATTKKFEWEHENFQNAPQWRGSEVRRTELHLPY